MAVLSLVHRVFKRKDDLKRPVSHPVIVVILGSGTDDSSSRWCHCLCVGGHASEMLALLRGLPAKYHPFIYFIMGRDDVLSGKKLLSVLDENIAMPFYRYFRSTRPAKNRSTG